MSKQDEHNFEVSEALRDGEQWLASFETPKPSDDALSRVKLAIRREMDTQADQDEIAGRSGRRYAGLLALAAMIAIGAGLARMATQQMRADPGNGETMTMFVASLESVLEPDDVEIASIDSQLAQYETGWDWDESYDDRDDVSTGDLFDQLLDATSIQS